ncbi:MAG: P1 family peptidase [Promethearchaeota archaeon]
MVNQKIRACDLEIPFDGIPGSLNAITDVNGVEVGHTTLISGDGELKVGQGPIRTGVTVIFPFGKNLSEGTRAGWFSLNGAGEMTGTVLIEEFGAFFGPIMITSTASVGVVRDSVIEWIRDNSDNPMILFAGSIPVVAETWDGNLNDTYGFHIKKEHVFQALDSAKGGAVEEGNVGGGTGMISYGFKGGCNC